MCNWVKMNGYWYCSHCGKQVTKGNKKVCPLTTM